MVGHRWGNLPVVNLPVLWLHRPAPGDSLRPPVGNLYSQLQPASRAGPATAPQRLYLVTGGRRCRLPPPPANCGHVAAMGV